MAAEYWYLHDQRKDRGSRLPVDVERGNAGPAGRGPRRHRRRHGAGLFVPHPDEPDPWRRARCACCDPDGADTATVWGQWQPKRPTRPWLRTCRSSAQRRRARVTHREPDDEQGGAPRRRGAPRRIARTYGDPVRLRRRRFRQDDRAGPQRVVALVGVRRTAIESIAAITFTEKAADELRQRVRLALLEGAAGDRSRRAGQRCRTALDDLDQAALCTLHAFAQRILTAFPVEAGLPPAVSVLDEIASDLDFDQRFQAFYAELLERPELERTLSSGVGARHHGGPPADRGRAVRRQLGPRAAAGRTSRPEPPRPDLRPCWTPARSCSTACDGLRPGDKLARVPPGLAARLARSRWRRLAAPGRRRGRGLSTSCSGRRAAAEEPGIGGTWAGTAYGSPDGGPRRGQGPGRPHGGGQRAAAPCSTRGRGRPRPPR